MSAHGDRGAHLEFDEVIPARTASRITPTRGKIFVPRRGPRGTVFAHRLVDVQPADLRPFRGTRFTLGDLDDLRGRIEATVAYRHLAVTAVWSGDENLMPNVGASIPVQTLLHWSTSPLNLRWARGEFALRVENSGGEAVRLRVTLVGTTESTESTASTAT